MNWIYAAIATLLFGGGWYCGELRGSDRIAQQSATQSAVVAARVQAEQAQSRSEIQRLNAVVAKYVAQEGTPDPIVAGVAGRLFKYKILTNTVSCPAAPAPGASSASGVPPSPEEPERFIAASQAVFDAAARDAARLNLCREAWPHGS
jgi:hypothetical protein